MGLKALAKAASGYEIISEIKQEITLFNAFSPNPGGQAEFLNLANWKSSEPLEHRWSAAIGGINCIAGETEINGIPVKELTNSPIKVQTLIGEKWASPAFIKGQANLYRVILRSGKEVLVTEQHRFLSPTGWAELRSLGCGSLVAGCDNDNEMILTGKSTSYQDHCLGHSHCGGELPHPLTVFSLEHLGLSSALSYDPPCTLFPHSIESFFLESERQHFAFERPFLQAFGESPHCQPQNLLQFLDKFRRSDTFQLFDSLEGYNLSYVDNPSCQGVRQILRKLWRRFSCLFQELQQYTHNSLSADSVQILFDNLFFSRWALPLGCEDHAFAMNGKRHYVQSPKFSLLPEYLNVGLKETAIALLKIVDIGASIWTNSISGNTSNDNSYWDVIEAIEYVRYDDFYDIHVPEGNHYLANGIWHHNSGKSFAGAVWANSRALIDPKARGMITANDYGQLSRATLVTLVEVCRLYNIPLEPWRESPEDQALAIANCQRCYIGHQKAFVYVISANNFAGKTQAGRGLQIRWVWADEFAYASEQAFLTIDGRLGRGPGELKGQGIITTSPAGYNYVYWKFGDPTREEKIQKLYKMASLSSLENIHSGEDYVESLKANYTDELYLQEIEGKFISTSIGLVYKYFTRSVHVLQGEDAKLLEYDRNLPLLLTFDFNHTPIVCLAAQKRGNEIHFCKEWFLMDSDIWELTESIVDWVEKHGIPPEIQVFGDATGRARTAASRLSSWDIVFQGLEPLAAMRGKGYLVRKFADANPFVVNRVHSVNQLFRQNRCYVHFANCQNFIKDLEQVTWSDEGINKNDNPLLSHLSDAAGYLIHSIYPFKKETRERKTVKRRVSGLAG